MWVQTADRTGVGFVGSVSDLILPPGALLMAAPDGEERRYAAPRERKLDSEQEHAVRVAASRGSSLRALAANHGVSHQTVAYIVGKARPAAGAA